MEAKVIKEEIIGDRIFRKMSDGSIQVESVIEVPGTQYGTLAWIKGEVTEEKIAKAKEMVVEDVCKTIREVANDVDDFFIIKTTDGKASVGHKFVLPTVEDRNPNRTGGEFVVE